MQPNEFEDAKLLWKMFYAEQCFKHAQAAAEHIFKEKLEENNPLFYSLFTAIYIIYGKPFRPSRGVGKLGEEIIPAEHLELHRLLLQHRDQIYAHADATGLELSDFGQANQVGIWRFLNGVQLFGTQFNVKEFSDLWKNRLCRNAESKLCRSRRF
jgi:hypothetical protein